MKKFISLFSIALLLFSAQAQNLYVSSSGSDGSPGTKAQPFKTIWKGVQVAQPGDTVWVADGSYPNTRIDSKNGTSSKWITIKAVNKWGPKIETSGNTYCFTVHNSSYIAVDGFEFTQESSIANRSATAYGFVQTEGHHITVRNCHAHHCGGNGIAMAYGDYFTAENNVSHHNAYWDPMQTSGISVYEPVASDNADGFHIVIQGNICYSNENKVPSPRGEYTDGNGIIMDDFEGTQGNSGHGAYTPASLVKNNICYDNGRKGIHVFSTRNVTVENNTCYWNNRAVRDNYNLNGELSNVWSGNIKWINNIAWANPAYNSTNNAIANGGDQRDNAGVEYIGNLTYNGTPGAASVRQWQTTADISAKKGNILGVNPQFVDPAKADFRLKPGSPAVGKGAGAVSIVTPPVPDPEPDPKPEPDPEPTPCVPDTIYKTIYVDVSGPTKTDTIYVAMQIDESKLVQAMEGKLLELVVKNQVRVSLNKKQQSDLLSSIQAYIAKLNDE